MRGDVPPEPGPDKGDGEGWDQYMSSLASEVAELAKREPDTPDVWRALALSEPGESAASRWLAGYGDRGTPYLLADARAALQGGVDDWHQYLGENALLILAHVAELESGPVPSKRISTAEVAEIRSLVHRAAGSPSDGVRAAAIDALGIVGNSMEDLTILENLAVTDPRVAYNVGATGTETRYFNREYARQAADQVRKRMGLTH
jgi:hypothetical protein